MQPTYNQSVACTFRETDFDPGIFSFLHPAELVAINNQQPTRCLTQRVLTFLDFSRFSAGLSGFVATTGHSEVLKPVVGVIGEWVATVAYGWINAGENLIGTSCNR